MTGAGQEARFQRLRERMVEEQIRRRGVVEPRVLEALRQVPRHRFVPDPLLAQAYEDYPLPIGAGQTISQPYIVGLMTELLAPRPEHHVLEIGCGSGYQTAVLSRLVARVVAVELRSSLLARAAAVLRDLGYANVQLEVGDGTRGWPGEAPYDGILVAAAASRVPPALLDQLKVGGRLVIPVGTLWQDLRLVTRSERGSRSRDVLPVRFVPLEEGCRPASAD